MKVKFLPMNKEIEIEPNKSIMNLAHENDIHISSVCNGMPSCAECRIRVIEGEHNMLPPGAKELSLIGTGHFIDQRRLSCQCICFGNVSVDLTEQLEKASEAKVNKKFLRRAQIENPEDSYSEGGILIEQDAELMSAEGLEKEPVPADASSSRPDSETSSKNGSSRGRRRRKRRPKGKSVAGGSRGSNSRPPKVNKP